MARRFFHALLMATIALGLSAGAEEPARIDFQKQVAPILRQNCIDCHGPDLQMADLRLDQRQFVLGDDADPKLVKAGASRESMLIKRLTDPKLGLIMPPTFPFFPGEKPGLHESAVNVLKAWIDQGAAWPDGLKLVAEKASGSDQADAKALFAAIRAGQHKAVATLIGNRRELVAARDQYGDTPLMHAAVYSNAEMLALLLDAGADVNAANHEDATPLMRAAGDFDKVSLLLSKGAKIDARSKLGRTPLLIAAAFPGNTKTVRLLLAHGANLKDQDQVGETCLTSAAKRGDAQMVKALLKAGADPATPSFFGRSPLVWAAEEGNVETLACLLEHGAAKVQPFLDFALSSAAMRGPDAAVRLLVEHGASAKTPAPPAGYTPLMAAAYSENCSVETAQRLLQRGADPKAQAANQETAHSLAIKRGSTEVARLLGAPADTKKQPSVVAATNPETAAIRDAAEKSLALLQSCGPTFFARSGCIACHQQSLTSLAVAAARTRSLKVDEATARDQTRITVLTGKPYRERLLQRGDHPVGSAPAVGYVLLGLAAERYPADEDTDPLIVELAGRQQLDGSWTAFGHRPPMEYSRVSATALGLRALQLFSPPGLKDRHASKIERARQWLLAAKPETVSDCAFRLLGLAWAGNDPNQVAEQRKALVDAQNEDGGWSQFPPMSSDAYATGLVLFALAQGGEPSTGDAYQRGISFLLSTQLPDGSWHVKTRSFPFQPYFESGFPHAHDQWISAAATGWATTAIIHALPATALDSE